MVTQLNGATNFLPGSISYLCVICIFIERVTKHSARNRESDPFVHHCTYKLFVKFFGLSSEVY